MQDYLTLEHKLEQYAPQIQKFRQEFPALNNFLIYFDNAATSLRPQKVLDAFIHGFQLAGNVERSLHTEELTTLVKQGQEALYNYIFPQASACPQDFLHLTYTQNTTEALNLLAPTLGQFWYKQQQGQKPQKYYLLVAQSNHHANILPWLKLAQTYNFLEIKTIPLKNNLTLDLDFLRDFCQKHAQQLLLITLSSVDNVNGLIHPIGEIKSILEQFSPHTWLALDNAQGSCFNHIYLQKNQLQDNWPADFIVGSLHKMFGLTGIGYLTISQRIAQLNKQSQDLELLAKFFTLKEEIEQSSQQTKSNNTLEHLNLPLNNHRLEHQWVGGGFVKSVDLETANYNLQPTNPFLIAGTPNINSLVTVKANIDWLNSLPLEDFYSYTHLLQQYFISKLAQLPQVADFSRSLNIVQDLANKTQDVVILPCTGHHILINIEDGLDIDLGMFLAQHNISARVGKHCAYPYHDFLGLDSTLRFSLAPFNTKEEVDYTINLIAQFLNDNLD
ncbi:aminotransferase class V-fold PLP-dependent enzyme [Psittacicella gerlachiana]|uniref:Aminotransferase class V domain-containing protein n=1 Tax=Psittacicella gerlachiana TaxID=2028574 RepID=A0A3A1Y8T8_9GAMM|nr:aminotransferase class V-fold PLP-dependent enzyme [Psittacicella gerlachiana]RIY34085.1 hypothetical protein CKF59_05845 [Psittacicella gerlachiana]